MSDYIDTRDGWRESDGIPDGVEGLMLFPADGGTRRTWVREVREVPVPPLPTVEFTVIRVEWKDDEDADLGDVLVRGDDQWSAVEADQWHDAGHLPEHITGFEVLAEPRAVTARAVLDRIYQEYPPGSFTDLTGLQSIAREFGVES